MSNQPQRMEDESLSSIQVENFLQKHPEFFHEHLALLENMSIPHPSGNAVSLISKQLEIFRSKHLELENQLTALIEIARENDTSFNRMHELTLALLEAETIEAVCSNLDKVLADCFLTDFVAIRIIKENADSPVENLFVEPDDTNLKHFDTLFQSNQSKCGHPTLDQARFLFGDVAAEVKSCAIIPMTFTRLEGIVAIGSRNDNRFHYSMGDMFLSQIGEVIGTRFIALLD